MPEIQMPDGHVYDVPENEVELATSQGGVPASAANPRAGGGNPLAGAAGLAAQGLEAIGGPRTLLYAGGAGLAGLVGKRLFGGRGAPQAAPADVSAVPPPANPRASASLVDITPELKARFKSELANYEPGDQIRRVELERIRRPGKVKALPEPIPISQAEGFPNPRANVSRGTPEVAASGAAPTAEFPGTRHDVQYYSGSRGQHVNIEEMNQKHIEQAFRSLAAKNPKPGSVARQQMDALLKESIYRLENGGIHIGQAEPLGGVRAARGGLGGFGGRALGGIGKAMGPAGIGGGLAAFAPQVMEMALSGNPQYQQMKQQDELISQAQDFYGPRIWNSAKSPEEQRALVLQFAQQHRPDISVSSLYGS